MTMPRPISRLNDLRNVSSPDGLGVADQRQHGPAPVRVGLQLGDLLGLERGLRAGDDQEGEVVGDRVLDQVELEHLVADGGQPCLARCRAPGSGGWRRRSTARRGRW